MAKFDRSRRLRGKRVFARVFAAKRSASNRLLVVYAAANDLPYTRVGVMVGKKHGTAVQRNRIKRLLREAFRLDQPALPAGFDLICLPRVGAVGTLDEYRRAMRTVCERATAGSKVR